jgi:hypothetical protein
VNRHIAAVYIPLLLSLGSGSGAALASEEAASMGSSENAPVAVTQAQPTSRWIVRANDNRAVLVRAGDQSLRLVTTIADGDLAVKKTVAVDGIRPWGAPPDVLRNSDGLWKAIRSTGSIAIDGTIKEEFHPEGLVLAPEKIVPDGNWHHFMSGCRSHDVHINDLNTCFDVGPGDIRGRVTLQKHRYIVYERCFQNVCDGQTVPIVFEQVVSSVLRVAYDSVASCGGEFVLTEEQWYCEGYGWCGFSNTRPDENVPASVGPVRLVEEEYCIDSNDVLCQQNENYCVAPPPNLPVPTPVGRISVYRFYDPIFINHMPSLDANELGPENGYRFEGLAYRTYAHSFSTSKEIFRCRAATSKLESFISDDSGCEGGGNTLDGSMGFVSSVARRFADLPLFRCYNAALNDHLSTTDGSECGGSSGYDVELGGPIGYVSE